MRKLSFLFVVLVVIMFATTGCVDKKPQTVGLMDSIAPADTAAEDTTEEIISETPMPKAADELFDDFFFNFAANKKLQYKRIHFPLPVYKNGKVVKEIQQAH